MCGLAAERGMYSSSVDDRVAHSEVMDWLVSQGLSLCNSGDSDSDNDNDSQFYNGDSDNNDSHS
jgi:hypothetical protein